jgi:hypothetical protein
MKMNWVIFGLWMGLQWKQRLFENKCWILLDALVGATGAREEIILLLSIVPIDPFFF